VKRPSALMVLVIVGIAGVIGLLIYGVASQTPDRSIEEAVARGEREPAPDIELPPLDGGEERSLEDWRGQVVVLNYWASWCEPCRDESPLLERWHRRISKRGATVLGIDVLDVTSDAKDFIEEYGLTYPHLRDKDGSTQEEFGIVAYPETFVIDREGRIVASQRGPVDEAFLRENVLPLLRDN
jgi:cytochrome c biogenesis protein CcmG/thiol:disulfide interchange protein DsbE